MPAQNLPDGALVRATGHPEVYVIQNGAKRWIPNPQTFALDGYNWSAVEDLDPATVDALPRGADMPAYGYLVAEGTHWSPQGGHEIYAHCDLNLVTGEAHGYTITTNYVQFAGFHSGTYPLFWNAQGDPIGPTGPSFRFVGDARWFGPPTVTPAQPWSVNIGGLASQVVNLQLALADAPDSLDQTIAKAQQIGSLDLVKDVISIGGAVLTGKPK